MQKTSTSNQRVGVKQYAILPSSASRISSPTSESTAIEVCIFKQSTVLNEIDAVDKFCSGGQINGDYTVAIIFGSQTAVGKRSDVAS